MKEFNMKIKKQEQTLLNYIQRPTKQYEMYTVWAS